jgi:hypothetical protein
MPTFTYLEDMLFAKLKAQKDAGCSKSAVATGQCLTTVLSGKVARLVKGDPAAETKPIAPAAARD